MPRRNAALSLVALATLGLATGCEKKSPIVTITADGVVVKAHATKYCRGDECDTSTDVPVIEAKLGGWIGIDVPRSVAEQGWRLGDEPFVNDHYRKVDVQGQFQPGQVVGLRIERDPKHGEGTWEFRVRIKR